MLIHQDLAAHNVLAAQREPWLVIDPKPLAGEVEFALAPIIRRDELGHGRDAVVRRLDHLTDGLGLDRERARGSRGSAGPPRTYDAALVAETLTVDWNAVAAGLIRSGWARWEDALGPAGQAILRDAGRPPWHDLPSEEGVVRQHGLGAFVPMAECDEGVRRVAAELVSALSAAVKVTGLPPVPHFNEAIWTYYPEGTGHITAHRDPHAYGGVIAVFTLDGLAGFEILSGDEPSAWQTAPGDLVLLRGERVA